MSNKFTMALTGGLVRSNRQGRTNVDPALSSSVADMEVQGGGQIIIPNNGTVSVPFPDGLTAHVVRVIPDENIGIRLNGSTVSIPVDKDGEFLIMRTAITSVQIVNESGSRAVAQVIIAGPYAPPVEG